MCHETCWACSYQCCREANHVGAHLCSRHVTVGLWGLLARVFGR